MKGAVSVGLVLAAFLCLWTPAQSQLPIPNRPDGYFKGDIDAPVVFEVFIDFLCPDSKAAWPNVKDVFDYYGGKVRLGIHVFPLAYHRNAFTAAQAGHVIAAYNMTNFWTWCDVIFDTQDQFYDAATTALSNDEVISMFGGVTEKAGIMDASVLTPNLYSSDWDWVTRVSWKYACSRTVASTPTFLVNGIPVLGETTWTVDDWRIILDPLVNADSLTKVPATPTVGGCVAGRKMVDADTCPSGEELCTYLPGKSQCCLAGEGCIPNVGCRCFANAAEKAVEKAAGCLTSRVHTLADTCPSGQESCTYLPGKTECCLAGEGCIPNVGCRCFANAAEKAVEKAAGCLTSRVHTLADTCPSGQESCTYLPGKTECCLAGEGCIPNVGCRC